METATKPRKVCFVTIGATAAFDSLIKAALHPAFLESLQANSYTNLRLQHGKEGAVVFREFGLMNCQGLKEKYDIDVSGFDFNKSGLVGEMRAAKGGGDGAEGVVISHAGSGSILEALRIAVPLIVIPNPELLDNHQEELAEAMAKQGYAVHGSLNDLPSAIKEAEALRQEQQAWPPANSGGNGKGLIGVMDDEMGFVD